MNNVVQCADDSCCVNCKYWEEVFRRGVLKYRCVNENSKYYMHDTDVEQCCEEFTEVEV